MYKKIDCVPLYSPNTTHFASTKHLIARHSLLLWDSRIARLEFTGNRVSRTPRARNSRSSFGWKLAVAGVAPRRKASSRITSCSCLLPICRRARLHSKKKKKKGKGHNIRCNDRVGTRSKISFAGGEKSEILISRWLHVLGRSSAFVYSFIN